MSAVRRHQDIREFMDYIQTYYKLWCAMCVLMWDRRKRFVGDLCGRSIRVARLSKVLRRASSSRLIENYRIIIVTHFSVHWIFWIIYEDFPMTVSSRASHALTTIQLSIYENDGVKIKKATKGAVVNNMSFGYVHRMQPYKRKFSKVSVL